MWTRFRWTAAAGVTMAVFGVFSAEVDLLFNGEGHPYGPERAIWIAGLCAVLGIAAVAGAPHFQEKSAWALAALGPLCALSLSLSGYVGGLLMGLAAVGMAGRQAYATTHRWRPVAGQVLSVMGGTAAAVLGALLWYQHGLLWIGATDNYAPAVVPAVSGPVLVAVGVLAAASGASFARAAGLVPLGAAVGVVLLLGWRWLYLDPRLLLPVAGCLLLAAGLRSWPLHNPAAAA